MSNFVRGLAELIAALGGNRFWPRLAALLTKLVDHHGYVAFLYRGNAEPELVFATIRNAICRNSFADYRSGAYLLDPFYIAFTNRKPDGVYRLRDISADRFFQSAFFRTYYNRTGLADEAGIFSWIGTRELVVVSIVRNKDDKTFSSSELDKLRLVEPVLSELFRHHVSLERDRATRREVGHHGDDMEISRKPDRRLRFGGQDKLTAREHEIAELILKGHSSMSMSLVLGISHDTVKVHRRHIYRKLAIASQAELFALAVGL